jgi:hypothetical protein
MGLGVRAEDDDVRHFDPFFLSTHIDFPDDVIARLQLPWCDELCSQIPVDIQFHEHTSQAMKLVYPVLDTSLEDLTCVHLDIYSDGSAVKLEVSESQVQQQNALSWGFVVIAALIQTNGTMVHAYLGSYAGPVVPVKPNSDLWPVGSLGTTSEEAEKAPASIAEAEALSWAMLWSIQAQKRMPHLASISFHFDNTLVGFTASASCSWNAQPSVAKKLRSLGKLYQRLSRQPGFT